MNYKPSSSEGKAISNPNYNKLIKLKKCLNPKRLKNTHTTKLTIAESAAILDEESSWFWRRYSDWSKFRRGLFWGITVAGTAIFSAGFGAALTQIDLVERTIAQNILPNVTLKYADNQTSLETPLNILLIAVKPDSQSMLKLAPGQKSESEKILVLKFDPQIGLARIINIPLDSQVKLPKLGWGTIADAHKHGGATLTTKMVEQLMNNVKIDRHLQATSQTYERLAASGKLRLIGCDARIRDCTSTSEQIEVQEKGFEAIRQRLNIPAYFSDFQEEIVEIRPNLDSNISAQEFVTITNFVKTLDQDNLSISFLPSYTPGEMLALNQEKTSTLQQLQNPPKIQTNNPSKKFTGFEEETLSLKNHPIAVENTTDDLDLGIKVVNFLRTQNFQDVYLVGHIPLELKQTKIIAGHGQLKSAKHLQDILGFGDLKHDENNRNRAVTVRIGSDANYLTQDNHL